MAVLLQFAIGLIFGLGLVIAGMANPAKVLNFLDLAANPAGIWDRSLAFVLAGAIAGTFYGSRLVLKRPQLVFGEKFHLPAAKELDARILAGPAICDLGWGARGVLPLPGFHSTGRRFVGSDDVRRRHVDRHGRRQSIADLITRTS